MSNFDGMLESFCQAGKMENMVYSKMVEYADSYNSDCVSVYVDLYKRAKTSRQRKYMLQHIYTIIIDEDTYKDPDEIIQNFKEIVSLVEFLNEKDYDEFDDICMKVINFFSEQYQNLVWGIDQEGIAPDASILASSMELKDVAEIIISTDMHNLKSYRMALLVLGS